MEKNYFIWHEKKGWKCKIGHGNNEGKGEFGSPWIGFLGLKGGIPIMLGPIWYLLNNIGTRMPQNHDSKKTPCAKTNRMHSIPITRNLQTITKVLGTILHFGSCILKGKKGSIYLINTTKKLLID